MTRVLVIEDQAKLRRNLGQSLGEAGYEAVCAGTREEGLDLTNSDPFDAVVLDLTLPGIDGLSVLAELREAGFTMPVLILTAQDSIGARVAGLDAGADDYLVKPFAHAELLARLRALLRRKRPDPRRVLACADLEMDLLARQVMRGDVELELSQREFELLEYLLRHKNRSVTREMLNRDVWKESGGPLTNAIDVCVNGLRKKIEIAGTPPLIQTVRGVGYTVGDRP